MSTLHITAVNATLMLVVMSSWASAQVMAPAPSPMMISSQGPSTSASSPAPEDGSTFGPSASGPTAPEDPCLNSLVNTTDCLTYVEAGSSLTMPDKGCCPEMAGLLDSNPVCLCELVGSNITAQFGIQIDIERAIKLPSLCKLSTPPTSLCAAVGYPIALPPGSALSPQPSSVSTPPASSPSTGPNEKGGAASIAASIAVSATSLFFGLVFSFLLTFF